MTGFILPFIRGKHYSAMKTKDLLLGGFFRLAK
jgi:hypothetical protein